MRWILSLCLALAATALAAKDGPPPKQYVNTDGTRLLAKPAAFAKAKAKLAKGQAVTLVEAKAGYVKVSLSKDGEALSGWLAKRALVKDKPKLSAKATRSKDASAEEVAAATKGFNKQVEAGLRENDKAGAYAKLDSGLARSEFKDPDSALEGFRQKGKLGEFKEGGE